jgi:hypothetical protein
MKYIEHQNTKEREQDADFKVEERRHRLSALADERNTHRLESVVV